MSREVEIARSSLGVDRIDVFLLHRDVTTRTVRAAAVVIGSSVMLPVSALRQRG